MKKLASIMALAFLGGFLTSGAHASDAKLTVKCDKCSHTFDGEKHKASRVTSSVVGTSAGAVTGGTGGFWLGSGVGVATGGTGFAALPFTTALGALGGGVIGGGVIGGMAGFIWGEGTYTCPKCENSFKAK